jgi:hypothetical protein
MAAQTVNCILNLTRYHVYRVYSQRMHAHIIAIDDYIQSLNYIYFNWSDSMWRFNIKYAIRIYIYILYIQLFINR